MVLTTSSSSFLWCWFNCSNLNVWLQTLSSMEHMIFFFLIHNILIKSSSYIQLDINFLQSRNEIFILDSVHFFLSHQCCCQLFSLQTSEVTNLNPASCLLKIDCLNIIKTCLCIYQIAGQVHGFIVITECIPVNY